MKDNLHLYPREYDPFIKMPIQALQLKHLKHIWRYLERLYRIEEGTWQEIPKPTLKVYLNQIEDQAAKTALQEFVVRHEMDQLWTFLSEFRRFLEMNCCTELALNPQQELLRTYLEYAGIDPPELTDVFPKGLMLTQAGYAYYYTAKYYQAQFPFSCDIHSHLT
eukprot:284963_1